MNTARYGAGGAGVQTLAIAFGGSTPPNTNSAVTELWNGTSWSNSTNLTTARRGLAAAGIQTAGLAFGGVTTAPSNATEEFTGAFLSTKKITTS